MPPKLSVRVPEPENELSGAPAAVNRTTRESTESSSAVRGPAADHLAVGLAGDRREARVGAGAHRRAPSGSERRDERSVGGQLGHERVGPDPTTDEVAAVRVEQDAGRLAVESRGHDQGLDATAPPGTVRVTRPCGCGAGIGDDHCECAHGEQPGQGRADPGSTSISERSGRKRVTSPLCDGLPVSVLIGIHGVAS